MGEGLRRKVMAWDDHLMLVKVEFEKGAIGAVHEHPHTQVSYVERGMFEVEIGGERRVLKGGDYRRTGNPREDVHLETTFRLQECLVM